MTITSLVVGFIVVAGLVLAVFVLMWRQDASRADDIAEDTERLDTQPDERRRRRRD
jgi:hypothetical protein